jgi:GNAT superfamily N-acetyltransferase
MTITIRPALPADAQQLSTVLCDSIRELCAADHGKDEAIIARWLANKTPEQMLRWLANPNITVLLAEREGAPAGVGCASRSGEILLNYVAPQHRFAGVSKAMLAVLETWLARQGVAVGRLSSTRTAHRFYLAMGWQDAGAPETQFGVGAMPMQKALPAMA